ncbi:MAG TPA: hypothetical protein VMU84_19340 [Thermoanaerobaculia bacterium]|nr:hypothetical protein [Thermoanaerobaculia bacterium]
MTRTGQPKEHLEGGRLKGGIFRSHLQWVRDHHPDAVPRVIARLSPDAAKQLGGTILATTWFPFAWLIELDRAITETFHGGVDMLRDLGRYSATINLSTTYRLLDRKANHEFFRNSALIHSQFQDFGKVHYEQTGESSGKMIHTSDTCLSPSFCMSGLGYYYGCIESHGGISPGIVETTCQCYGDAACVFDMHWK